MKRNSPVPKKSYKSPEIAVNLQVVNPYWARLSYRTFLIGPFFNCVKKKTMNVILQREVNLLALLDSVEFID